MLTRCKEWFAAKSSTRNEKIMLARLEGIVSGRGHKIHRLNMRSGEDGAMTPDDAYLERLEKMTAPKPGHPDEEWLERIFAAYHRNGPVWDDANAKARRLQLFLRAHAFEMGNLREHPDFQAALAELRRGPQ